MPPSGGALRHAGGVTWRVVPGSLVQLRSDKLSLVRASAPVIRGELQETEDEATLVLTLDLSLLEANPLLQRPARALVRRHGAADLVYRGSGDYEEGIPVTVYGKATAGDVVVDLVLTLDRDGAEARVSGTANVGTVELPLPGLGRIEDFSFSVSASLPIVPA